MGHRADRVEVGEGIEGQTSPLLGGGVAEGIGRRGVGQLVEDGGDQHDHDGGDDVQDVLVVDA